MTQEQLNRLVKLITTCATMFVLILVGIIVFQRIKVASIQNEIEKTDKKIELLSSKKSELESDLDDSKSPLYIEDVLRNDLKIKDNEDYFVIEER